mmetsp:Transcript_21956/g.61019  ORF Transcript_21956/g.61019 Transcript_21956/m.61019 type:complete len:211 (-) Transcript_21956:8486-9118(-)
MLYKSPLLPPLNVPDFRPANLLLIFLMLPPKRIVLAIIRCGAGFGCSIGVSLPKFSLLVNNPPPRMASCSASSSSSPSSRMVSGRPFNPPTPKIFRVLKPPNIFRPRERGGGGATVCCSPGRNPVVGRSNALIRSPIGAIVALFFFLFFLVLDGVVELVSKSPKSPKLAKSPLSSILCRSPCRLISSISLRKSATVKIFFPYFRFSSSCL